MEVLSAMIYEYKQCNVNRAVNDQHVDNLDGQIWLRMPEWCTCPLRLRCFHIHTIQRYAVAV